MAALRLGRSIKSSIGMYPSNDLQWINGVHESIVKWNGLCNSNNTIMIDFKFI